MAPVIKSLPSSAASDDGKTSEAEQLLERLVESLGGSSRPGAERRGAVRNRTRQALSDSPGPNVQHVLEELEGLGIEPRLFLDALYGEEEHAPFPDLIAEVYRRKLREMDAPAEPPAPERKPADPSARVSSLAEPEVRQLIEDRLSEAFRRVKPKRPD